MEMSTSDGTSEGTGSNSSSVADQLTRHLQAAIVEGRFALGKSLPSERELMAMFRVSRTSVREALRVLRARGLVEVRRGRRGGSYVANQTSKSLVRSLELFINGQDVRLIDLVIFRQAIGPASAAQAALLRTDEQLEELRLRCTQCENLLHDIDGFAKANLDWHWAVAKASNNPLFYMFLRSISSALHTATDGRILDVKARKAIVGVHWQVYAAINNMDPDAARRRMERHLAADQHTLAKLESQPDNQP